VGGERGCGRAPEGRKERRLVNKLPKTTEETSLEKEEKRGGREKQQHSRERDASIRREGGGEREDTSRRGMVRGEEEGRSPFRTKKRKKGFAATHSFLEGKERGGKARKKCAHPSH